MGARHAVAGRRVSTVHQGRVGAPNELATGFTTLSLIWSNEVCKAHDITPRLIPDLLDDFPSRCWPRSTRETDFFRKTGSSKTKSTKLGPQATVQAKFGWDLFDFWPSISTGLRGVTSRVLRILKQPTSYFTKLRHRSWSQGTTTKRSFYSYIIYEV